MAAVVAALAALLLTACGSDGGDDDGGKVATLQKGDNAAATTGSTSSAGASEDPSKQLAEFASCMRKNGVDMPDPDVGEDGKVEMRAGKAGGKVGEAKEPKVDADFEKAHRPARSTCRKWAHSWIRRNRLRCRTRC